MSDKPTVAQEVLAYCTSCKMDLAHLIVAMKGDKISKAECKTCKKTHAFKAPKGITEPPAKKKSKKAEAAEKEIVSLAAEWEKLMNANPAAPIKKYGLKTSFTLGDKIAHPNFGDGIVERLIYPNKIEVMFKTAVKTLIHAGQ